MPSAVIALKLGTTLLQATSHVQLSVILVQITMVVFLQSEVNHYKGRLSGLLQFVVAMIGWGGGGGGGELEGIQELSNG